MRFSGDQAPGGRRRAGTHRRGAAGAGPLLTRRDHVQERPRRGLPAPSPSALVGLAVLVLIAVGAIHLSGTGTAVPLEDPPSDSAIEPRQEPRADSSREGADESTTGAGAADGGGTSDRTGTAEDTASGGAAASDSASPSAELVVHVSGAVADPGVVHLHAGARVDDALRAAGGAHEDADLAAVNLARPVADGEQIHVPRPGEEPPAAAGPDPAGTPAGPASAEAGSGDGGGGLIDLNTADAAALEELPGVGPAIAGRIIEHREKNGPFTSVDDLLDVSGIGPATLEGLREQATV